MYRDGRHDQENESEGIGDPYQMNYNDGGESKGYEYIAPGVVGGEPGRKNSGVSKHIDRSKMAARTPPRGLKMQGHLDQHDDVCKSKDRMLNGKATY